MPSIGAPLSQPSTVVHDRLGASDDGWTLVERGRDPDRAAAIGSNFMVGNGYLGYRGTTPDQDATDLVALVVTDTYDCADGRWTELCTVPDPMRVVVDVARGRVGASEGSLRRGLHLRSGEFGAETETARGVGGVAMSTRRFASAVRLHLLAQRCTVSAVDAGDMEAKAGIDAVVWSLNGEHFRHVDLEDDDGLLVAHAVTTEHAIDVFVVCAVRFTGLPEGGIARTSTSLMRAARGTPGDHVTVETFAAVYTSNDVADPRAAAIDEVRRAQQCGYDALLDESRSWWAGFWDRTDAVIDGPAVDQVALRFAAYHNRICTPAHTDHLPIGARGLSCQAYQGAAFWDQEVFNLPAFLFTEPEITRSLLIYRHRTLDGARRKAKRLGYAGAYYAWISGITGDELCPDIFFTDVLTGRPIRNHFNAWQMHIAPDIVTTLDRYVAVTGDEQFMVDYGAEIAFEVARFLHSFVRLDVRNGTYHCIRLLGPDEWHENVDDNAFTNYQAKAALDVARSIHRRMTEQHPEKLAALRAYIGLSDEEVAAWDDISTRLLIPPPDPETGIVEQFRGFFELEDITPRELRTRLLHPEEYWGWPNGIAVRTKVSKQADVVMLMWLHEHEFAARVRAANYDYYEPFCSHGSTLSPSAHAMVAARFGRTDEALSMFRKTALVDLASTAHAVVAGTFIGGIHTAACGGTYQVAVQGFGGLGFVDGRLTIDPALPAAWSSLTYPVSWRGARLAVAVTHEGVTVRCDGGSRDPVPLRILGTDVVVDPGAEVTTSM